MNNKFLFSFILICSLFSTTFPISQSISGKPLTTGIIKDGVQYIKKGDPYFDLNEAPVVVTVNDSDQSIEVYGPNLEPIDSVFFHWIPGNLITVKLEANIVWDEVSQIYLYSYIISSDNNSKRPIWHLEIEMRNSYYEVITPDRWHVTQSSSRNRVMWTRYSKSDPIMPGQSKSGFGIKSNAPPELSEFAIWGEEEKLEYRITERAEGSIGEAYHTIEAATRGVSILSIIPGIVPERIEPARWFRYRIFFKLIPLRKNGYINPDVEEAIRPILDQIAKTFKAKENHDTTKLEQEINTTLSALEPFRNQMEPEAWSYITENLKFVLRNLDIVKF